MFILIMFITNYSFYGKALYYKPSGFFSGFLSIFLFSVFSIILISINLAMLFVY